MQCEDIWIVSFYYKHQASYERKEQSEGQEGLKRVKGKDLVLESGVQAERNGRTMLQRLNQQNLMTI